MKVKLLTATATLLLLSCANYADAQMARMVNSYLKARESGVKLKSYQRYELGYSQVVTSANFTHQFTASTTDYTGTTIADTTIRINGLHPTSNIGVTAATYFPLSSYGEHSILALSVGAIGNIMIFSPGEIKLWPYNTYDYTITTMQIGIPISIDYKHGADGMMDKSERYAFTGGLGFMPTMLASQFGDIGDTKFRFTPFLKAEVGFFAGIMFKVKATYAFGNFEYLKVNQDGIFHNGDSNNILLKAKSNLTLSLVLMPFSWDWERSNGWR